MSENHLWIEEPDSWVGEFPMTLLRVPVECVYAMLEEADKYGKENYAAVWVGVRLPTNTVEDYVGQLDEDDL